MITNARLPLVLLALLIALALCSRGRVRDECDGTHQVKFERCL